MERLTGDAAVAARRWNGEVEAINPKFFSKSQLVIDALFGAGLKRDLQGEAAQAVKTVNAVGNIGVPILAVDLPSGIDGATGQVRGVAVKATETISFCRRKLGHLLLPGRMYAGRIHVADIGILNSTIASIASKTFVNEPSLWRHNFPIPRLDQHKYDRGHAIVVSGPMHATGAARLAAVAALRAGAGLVTVAAPKDAVPVLAAHLTSVMVRQTNGAAGLAKLLTDTRLNAVLLGPGQGVGQTTKSMVLAATKARRAIVLDADALTSFAGQSTKLAKVFAEVPSAVITPHDGEFRRLFNRESQILESESKVEKVRLSSKTIYAVVMLKGADTVVAAPDGRVAIADNAPATLATAGSGDVLAGFTLGLLTQRTPAFEAACAAVWLHGECGREAGPGMIAEDLPQLLPRVLRRLLAE